MAVSVTVTRLTVTLHANVKLDFPGMAASVQVNYVLFLISYLIKTEKY